MKPVLIFILLPLLCYGQAVDTVYLDGAADTLAFIKSGYAITILKGKKTSEGLYKDGLEEGYWIYYSYENGTAWKEGNYVEGHQEGLWKIWNTEGKLYSEENYNHNTLEGLSTTYHPNGNKASEGNYKSGRQEGIWTEWDSDGSIRRQVEIGYEDGTEKVLINNEIEFPSRFVIPVLLILIAVLVFKYSSVEQRKRMGKTLAVGCLAPLVVIILLSIIFFGGDHPNDAGAAFGMLLVGGFIVLVVLPILAIVWIVWFVGVWIYFGKAHTREVIQIETIPMAPEVKLTQKEKDEQERKKSQDD